MESVDRSLDLCSLQFIETGLAGNVEGTELEEYLNEVKDLLLDPLKHKVRTHGFSSDADKSCIQ
jgi:hypothetical protein